MDDYSLWLRNVATETRSWVAHVYDRRREKKSSSQAINYA